MARLKGLVVEDFRSIRGRIQISLDAPVVLVHGPNGSGKTSLLSAIETSLLAAAPTLERIDPNYVAYLPHKDSATGQSQLELTVETLKGDVQNTVSVTAAGILGAPMLTPELTRFFTERCYLGQSTLNRLLEIYQSADAKKTDSALTRFVKELLGLEPLDALIDGLQSAGNVRRLRVPTPTYWAAREELPELIKKVGALDSDITNLKAEELASAAQIVLDLVAVGDVTDPSNLQTDPTVLELAIEADERELLGLATIRRELAGARQQVEDALAAQLDPADLVQAEAAARIDLENWQAGPGHQLEAAISELASEFPSLPSLGSEISSARAAAEKAVADELARVRQSLAVDEKARTRQAELDELIRQGRGRLAALDAEMTTTADTTDTLAKALSEMTPHIHGDDCPVCGRDYSEISEVPLAVHVGDQIRQLVDTAGRLQALSRDRNTTVAAVSRAENELADLVATRLPGDTLDGHKNRGARLAEQLVRLQSLGSVAEQGAALQAQLSAQARFLTQGQGHQAALMSLHSSVADFTTRLGVSPLDAGADLRYRLDTLLAIVDRRQGDITTRQIARGQAQRRLFDLRTLAERIAKAEAERASLHERRTRLENQKGVADKTIDKGRDLANRARSARTTLVSKVFNNELNAVWRDLFIRLAPDEPFVPAFALPQDDAGAVEAVLETHYRQGGIGGNPRTMLSAGNLNTAALTLFMALHLSVKPALPWLIIDDPVQSMDEVHIAQFAALLRTLSKQHGRQVIIAVHERSLFEYLSLELSPAFLDDRLITVELGRAPDGASTAIWAPHTFAPDRAIAA